jgi:hypothetical protein
MFKEVFVEDICFNVIFSKELHFKEVCLRACVLSKYVERIYDLRKYV